LRSRAEIERRIASETDAFVIQALSWAMETDCPLCLHKSRKEFEIDLHTEETTADYLETKYGWPDGSVMRHMTEHIDYDPTEAREIEEVRAQAIDTLDSATHLFNRMDGWLDELEELKDQQGGISSQWIADVSKVVGQCNASLKLIGQLKKEIGVESQLLIAEAHMDSLSRILVDTLGDTPDVLDQIELRMAALKAPTHIMDADFTVTDDA